MTTEVIPGDADEKPKEEVIQQPKKKTGRPLITETPATLEELIFDLARIQCTHSEMSAVLKISEDTLVNRFSDIIKSGKESGKESLRRAMFKKALVDDNAVMMIWLSKNVLGYADKQEVSSTSEVKYQKVDKAKLKKAIEKDAFLKAV